MTDRAEGALATLAAMFVLFTALLDPRVSAALAVVFLLVLAGYKLRQVRTRDADPADRG